MNVFGKFNHCHAYILHSILTYTLTCSEIGMCSHAQAAHTFPISEHVNVYVYYSVERKHVFMIGANTLREILIVLWRVPHMYVYLCMKHVQYDLMYIA